MPKLKHVQRQAPWKEMLCCLGLHSLLSPLSYMTQDALLRDGTANNWLCPLMSVNNKENVTWTGLQANWMEVILKLRASPPR